MRFADHLEHLPSHAPSWSWSPPGKRSGRSRGTEPRSNELEGGAELQPTQIPSRHVVPARRKNLQKGPASVEREAPSSPSPRNPAGDSPDQRRQSASTKAARQGPRIAPPDRARPTG